MVRITFERDPRELPALLRALTGVVAWKDWEARVAGLRASSRRNPVWERFVRERYGLELAFGEVRDHLRETGRIPWPPRNAEEARLYAFALAAVGVYARLSNDGKARLAGAIERGLQNVDGLGPLAFELRVAVHLMRRGFDVFFHDLELGGGYDFLATRGTAQIEVECKHVSADLGRQIHRRDFYSLGELLHPVFSEALQTGSGQFLKVTLPGRLTARREQHLAIVDRISAVLSGAMSRVEDAVCAVEMCNFPIPGSPFDANDGHRLTLSSVENFALRAFGIEQAHLMIQWRPGYGAIVLQLESRKPDRVLAQLINNLREDTKRQFSGYRPALLCLHLADVTEPQLLELVELDRAGEGTGIQRAASILLHKRPHLHSIALMTDGSVVMRDLPGQGKSVEEFGPSYVFSNPQHPHGIDPRLRNVFF